MTQDTRLLWLLDQATEHPLTTSQVAVLAMLLAFDARGLAQVSKAELGALVGLKERQVANVLKELEVHIAEFIHKHRNGGAGKGRAPNSYAIRPDATGNTVPATWYVQQSSAGNAVPSASPNQHSVAREAATPKQSSTGNGVLVACGEPVPAIRNAPARGLDNSSSVELEEIHPERLASFNNGHALALTARELAAIIVKRVNSPWLDPHKSQRLPRTVGRIHAWLAAGADFEADILPTVRDVCRRMNGHGEQINTWGYFDAPVRKAAAQRKAAETPMLPITAEEAKTHDRNSTLTADGLDVRRPKISASTAVLLRQMRGDADDEWGVDYHAVK